MAAKLSIIGVGNREMGDDGIGVILVERLRGQIERGEWAAGGIELVSAGTDPLLAGAVAAESPRTLILDAAKMDAPAGEIRFFQADDAAIPSQAWTTHSLPLSGVLELLTDLGRAAGLRVAGIQPASMEPGQGISPQLESRVPEMLEKIKEEVLLP